VLIAISEVLPDYPIVSLETGCGKSTVMFSNLASQHFVFAYDDRDAPESSVTMVQSDPDFQAANTTFVYGPTQRTLPVYRFPDGLMFDVILIDGPHGYPFPDLEYALLYDRLKPGGILILDDIHIASIGAMYDILRDDRMYEEIGVFSTTGLLRRSTLEGVPSDGDHWFEQNYNVSRFPLPMAKYHPDRGVSAGRVLALTDPAILARVAVKALELDPDGTGARTIDMMAVLDVDLGGHEGPVTVDLNYRTIHEDAAAGATITSGTQSYPLPVHRKIETGHFRFETVAGRPLRLTLLHPAAATEHDRGITRYDFRRLGVVVESIKLHSGATPDAFQFDRALKAYASYYPYVAGVFGTLGPNARTLLASQSNLHRFIGNKCDLHFGELLPFEGAEFAIAAAWALCGRSATPEERLRLDLDRGPLNRLIFALELDQQNRKSNAMTRLHGLKLGRRLWRTERFLRRKGLALPAKWMNGLLRQYSKAKVSSLLLQASQHLLILNLLDSLPPQQSRLD
jgi:SAM-dependent methyltransferase